MTKIIRVLVFKCGMCNEGEIIMNRASNGKTNAINISKCSNKNCKHQYYFKQLMDAKLEQLPKSTMQL